MKAFPDDDAEPTLAQKTVRRLRVKGLKLPQRPGEDAPELPPDLTELPDDALMSTFVELTNWSEFAGTRLAQAAVDEKQAETNLDRYRAIAAVKAKSEKSVTAQKAAAAADPEVHEFMDTYNTAYATRKLLESIYNGLNAKAAVVSRELTRRVGRNDRESRAQRWSS